MANKHCSRKTSDTQQTELAQSLRQCIEHFHAHHSRTLWCLCICVKVISIFFDLNEKVHCNLLLKITRIGMYLNRCRCRFSSFYCHINSSDSSKQNWWQTNYSCWSSAKVSAWYLTESNVEIIGFKIIFHFDGWIRNYVHTIRGYFNWAVVHMHLIQSLFVQSCSIYYLLILPYKTSKKMHVNSY